MTFVHATSLVERHAERAPTKDGQEVNCAERLGLKDALHERQVDKRYLGEERDGASEEQHPVGEQRAVESAVLDGRRQIEEDKGRKGLYEGKIRMSEEAARRNRLRLVLTIV